LNRSITALFVALLTAVILAACAASSPEPAVPAAATAAPTLASLPAPERIVEVTVEISTPGPTETPVACTPMPPGMSLRLIPTSEFSFQLEAAGLLATENLTVIISGSAPARGSRDMRSYLDHGVVDGRFSDQFNLRSGADIPNWEAQLIHARGVACLTFSLPLPADPIEITGPAVAEPTATPKPPPPLASGDAIRTLRTGQTVWFAQGDAIWRSDVHGVELDRLTSDGFMDPEGPGFASFTLPGLRLSPDGRWLVNRHNEQGLLLVDLATGQERLLRVWARTIAWSPDSRFLAYAPGEGAPGRAIEECAVCLYDLAQDDHISLVPHATAHDDGVNNVLTMSWSPDGERLAYGCCFTPREPYEGVSDGRIEIVTITTGEREQAGPLSASVAGGMEHICWVEAGSVITSWENQELCADPARANTALSVNNLLAGWAAVYDEDNRWTGSRLYVTNQATGQLLWERFFDGWTSLQLAWSPDGRYLFFSDSFPNAPIWRVTADGENLTEIIAEGYLLGVVRAWEALTPPLTISPDGRWRVVAQVSTPVIVGEDEMEEFPSGAKYQVTLTVESTDSDLVWGVVDEWRNSGLGADYPGPLQWSADGRYLFFTNVPVPDGCAVFVNGGDLWRLDLQTGEAVELLPFVGLAMALSPDSQTLAYYGAYGRGFQLHDLTTGMETPLDLPDYGGAWWQIGGISWSPDGRQLVLIQVIDPCGDQLTAVLRLDLDQREFVTLIEPDERGFTLLNWRRDREIRLLDGDGRVWYLETNSGEIAGGRPLD
jgi:Tol biopolymer transport system component